LYILNIDVRKMKVANENCFKVLFSNILSLHSSLNVRDHASQPNIRTGNIIVLYVLIFKFLARNREDKSVWTE